MKWFCIQKVKGQLHCDIILHTSRENNLWIFGLLTVSTVTIQFKWENIAQFRCAKLVETYPYRLKAVIKAKGSSTKYWHKGWSLIHLSVFFSELLLLYLSLGCYKLHWIQLKMCFICLHFKLQSNKMWIFWRGRGLFSIPTVPGYGFNQHSSSALT